MLAMHLLVVCNMSMSVRAFVISIAVIAVTEAAEIRSNYKATTKSYESIATNKWKEPPKIYKWEQPTTKRIEPAKNIKWEQSTTTTLKEPTRSTNWKKPLTSTKWVHPANTRANLKNQQDHVNHVTAITSVSNIDSRNGRLSSINGISVYPPADSSIIKTDNKGTFIFRSIDGNMPAPITITKQGDGVSGIIRILPGSVSVSSSASSSSKAGPASAVASFSPWSNSFMMPRSDDIYFPPFPIFTNIPEPNFEPRIPESSFNSRISDPFSHMRIPEPRFRSRIQDPWFNRNKQSKREDIFMPKWYYPTFNPFMNFWK